ncbi:ABC transporter ATP-binding protein [Aestuariibius sp. 2305UL40-4]|uniref:ABC transporter ATP-binding protein n=1 Tax=Aestuariibius violaceus TaxID=3234132 RepID=UPI00345EE392
MASIALSHISKSFGDTQVLRDVSLSILDGEFVTLVGPSGCGKSTLLRILAGLEAADSGHVALDGRDVTAVRPAHRNLAMVFQSYALYPHLTVAQNLATPLKLRDLGRTGRLPVVGPLLARTGYGAIGEQVRVIAGILQIGHLLDRKPGQLSGGQRQRVALGRAMVRQPVAFLMDEPLSNLDAALRVHMRSELSELHRRLGATFVYVTHDQAEALTMSDRMAVMMGGNILQFGSPAEVFADPRSLAVAEFIGSPKINTLPGEISTDGRVSYLGVVLNRRVGQGRVGPVTVGLRPEHLSLRSTPADATLSGRLTFKENLGSDVFLHAVIADGQHRLILRTDPARAAALALGDTIHVEGQRSAALIFDAEGQRLPMTTGAGQQAEVA